jgi:Ca-activated chloride channel family protein
MIEIWTLLLLATPFLIWLYIRLARYKKKSRLQLTNQSDAGPRNWVAFTAYSTCLISAWLLLVIAMLIPNLQDNRDLKTSNQGSAPVDEILFFLDTSSSMKAEDTSTGESRLDRAKEIIESVVENLGGINVQLVAFGQDAVVVIPPTEDYLYFRLLAESIDVNEFTNAGTSLSAVLGMLEKIEMKDPFKKSRMIVLLTDGEDTSLLDLTSKEKQKTIQTLLSKVSPALQWDIVALGTESGGLVPAMQYEGMPVTSYMQKELLESLARQGSGKFYDEHALLHLSLVGNILADIAAHGKALQAIPAGQEAQGQQAEKVNFVPVFAAFALILIALLLPQGKIFVRVKS